MFNNIMFCLLHHRTKTTKTKQQQQNKPAFPTTLPVNNLIILLAGEEEKKKKKRRKKAKTPKCMQARPQTKTDVPAPVERPHSPVNVASSPARVVTESGSAGRATTGDVLSTDAAAAAAAAGSAAVDDGVVVAVGVLVGVALTPSSESVGAVAAAAVRVGPGLSVHSASVGNKCSVGFCVCLLVGWLLLSVSTFGYTPYTPSDRGPQM